MATISLAPAESFRQKMQQALMGGAFDTSAIQSPWQGASRLAQALMLGLEGRDEERQNKEAADYTAKFLGGALGGAPAAAATPVPAMTPQGGQSNFGNAIAGIESGGKYDALGPVTKTGDRAFGKYQIMGANVGPWTQAALGQAMTPEQFLADPKAQDAVFQSKFGEYVKKYGPEGAARAWFAGEGGMNNPNAKDQLGTSVSGYAGKFMQALGGPQVASAAPGAPQVPQAAQAAPAPAMATQASNIGPQQREILLQGLRSNNPRVRAQAAALAQQYLKAPEYSFHVAGDKLYAGDKTHGTARPVGDATKPTFGVIGKDQFGKEIYGWTDPAQRSVSPTPLPQSGQAGQSVIPQAPPGVDPKIFRDEQSKRFATNSMPASEEMTSKLRKEIQDLPSYKNIAQAAPVYKSMADAAGRDNRAADVNLIYGMAKIMDPGSVVRESEMSVAQAISTLPQALQAQVKSQLAQTGRISPDVRVAIMQEARSRLSAYQSMFDQDATMYRGIAQRNRMNEQDVLPTFGPFDEYKPAAKPPAPADVENEMRRRGLLK